MKTLNSTSVRGADTFTGLRRLALWLVLCGLLQGALFNHSFAATKSEVAIRERLAKLSEVHLHVGANEVEFRAIDGVGKATVKLNGKIFVFEIEHTGTAGHATYVSTVKGDSGFPGQWVIIPIRSDPNSSFGDEFISDSPLTGVDAVKVVRFFRGLVDGRSATILVTAKRDLSGTETSLDGSGSAVPARIMVFALHVGKLPPAHFLLEGEFTTSAKYCNANDALWKELSIPLPASLPNPVAGSGC